MTVERKAQRLVDGNKVHLQRSIITDDGDEIRRFTVDGDHDTYEVRWDPYGMKCTCPARVRCSHELAAALWCDRYNIHELQRGNVVDEYETRGEDE